MRKPLGFLPANRTRCTATRETTRFCSFASPKFLRLTPFFFFMPPLLQSFLPSVESIALFFVSLLLFF